MESGLVQYPLFFITATIAGAMNAVAGGGSFLLFPILMMGGMPAVAANVMCSVAMWPGSLASCYAYWREIKTPLHTLRPLLVFAIAGGAVGAAILLYFPDHTFERLVPWLLLGATIIFTFGRYAIAYLRMEHASTNHVVIYAGMFVIAVYGGYFGAGMGILMLAMMQLAGQRNMHEMNGLKTVLGSGINAAAVVIFVGNGEVLWEWAWVLIAGGIFGGYAGTRLALKVDPEKIRRLVVMIACAMTAYFFWK